MATQIWNLPNMFVYFFSQTLIKAKLGICVEFLQIRKRSKKIALAEFVREVAR